MHDITYNKYYYYYYFEREINNVGYKRPAEEKIQRYSMLERTQKILNPMIFLKFENIN